MHAIETPEMKALRIGLEQTIHGLCRQAEMLREQVTALEAQNYLLSGHVSDLLEMVGRLQSEVRAREAA